MPESLPQLILPIKLERSPERLTSLGGLVVLEELARAAGVWEKVDRRVEGPKSGRGYQPHEFVQPLVWMLHAEEGGWRTCGSCEPSSRYWNGWAWSRCRMLARWETGCAGKDGRGPRGCSE